LKFKSIFILFNIVILIALLFVCAMPFLVLGADFALPFWRTNWPLALILVLILAGIDGFFIINQRLFTLLEREDWPALATYLENRIIQKKRYSPRLVRLLANTYLVLSDSAAVLALEKKVSQVKPPLLDKNALVFGLARVLSKDHGGAVSFFSDRLKNPKVESPEWVRWYYGFSLLLVRDFPGAANALVPLALTAQDPLVTVLAQDFLAQTVISAIPERSEEIEASVAQARTRILKTLPTKTAWNREIEKSRTEIHVVILSKSLEEAGQRLYSEVTA
jgi:hypothetical protein